MNLSLIVAMDRQGVIGYRNQLPWHLPADLKHFRTVTMGKPVIMGHQTFLSIGKPLVNRVNIVLSREHNLRLAGCQVVHSLAEILTLAHDYPESIVIGGASVYQLLFPYIKQMYLTLIDAEFTGDTFFPKYDHSCWQEISRKVHPADSANPYSYQFIVLTRFLA